MSLVPQPSLTSENTHNEAPAEAPTIAGAKHAFAQGDREKTLRILDDLDSLHGPRAETYRFRASVYFFAGEYDRALSEIRVAIAHATGPTKGHPAPLIVMKAEILNRMGDNLGAMRALETVPAASRKGSFFRVLRECVRSRGEIPLFEAIAAPSFVSKDLTLSTSMNNYSILLREMGDARAGIAVARERFMKARRAFKFGRLSKPVEKPGWVDEAKACLADLKAHFAQGGVSFFLISGVFLGAVRDQAIIGHDKDIDVGVDETVSVERIKELFRHSETFVIREIPSKRSVYLMHCSGVKVDVFIHYLENGRYWHEGPKVRWWNTPFELESIAFLGDTYLSPKNKDLYLVENYGDWRTPVSEFETFVDTPNMEITSGDHMIWYYLTKLTDYYLQGRKPQLQRVWNALTERYRADDALKRAVEQVMETDYDAARRQRESKTHTVNVRTPALVIGRLIKKLTIGGARNL